VAELELTVQALKQTSQRAQEKIQKFKDQVELTEDRFHHSQAYKQLVA
jgi:hypothetical protein